MKSLYNGFKSSVGYVSNTVSKARKGLENVVDKAGLGYLNKNISKVGKDLGYVAMVPAMALTIYSCGGETPGNNTELKCNLPQNNISFEQSNGDYVNKCALESECDTKLEENNGVKTCNYVKGDFEHVSTSCSDDYTSILDQNGDVKFTCNSGKYCEINARGSPNCVK